MAGVGETFSGCAVVLLRRPPQAWLRSALLGAFVPTSADDAHHRIGGVPSPGRCHNQGLWTPTPMNYMNQRRELLTTFAGSSNQRPVDWVADDVGG